MKIEKFRNQGKYTVFVFDDDGFLFEILREKESEDLSESDFLQIAENLKNSRRKK